jgi:hypothetical protein
VCFNLNFIQNVDEVLVVGDSTVDYQVKVINPDNKSGSVVKTMAGKNYESPKEVEKALMTLFPCYAVAGKFLFGYIEPGHRFKGKQQPLSCGTDLKAMYKLYSGKPIKLWLKCMKIAPKKSQKKSRLDPRDENPLPKRTAGPGYDSHLKNLKLYMINSMPSIQKPIHLTKLEHGHI